MQDTEFAATATGSHVLTLNEDRYINFQSKEKCLAMGSIFRFEYFRAVLYNEKSRHNDDPADLKGAIPQAFTGLPIHFRFQYYITS